MEHLLNKRLDGFHETLYTDLIIAMISVIVGGLIAFFVVRSITRPLNQITGLMGKLTAGRGQCGNSQ